MEQVPKLIGKSLPIQKLRYFIKKAAKSDATTVFLGETGVGKEVAAQLIHYSSNRKNNPLIKINCANLSDTLIESELFGLSKKSSPTRFFLCFSGKSSSVFPLLRKFSAGATQVLTSTARSGLRPKKRQSVLANT